MADELFKVIFKLEGDNAQLIKSLDEVNSKYKEQDEELKKHMVNLKTLQANEAALMKGRELANNPTAFAKYNKLIEETRTKILAVKTSVENLTVTNQKNSKSTEDLGKKIKDAFDATKINAATQEVKKLNDNIAQGEKPVISLRAQLRLLKEQLANTDDDKEFERISIEAGKLEDKINDAREAARIFATDSPFQSVGRGIQGVVGDLLSLDFAGAAQKSQLLAKAASQITFKTSLSALKDIGTTLFNLGKALLTNPLFLMGAAIFAIVTNFEALKNLGGPIGEFFKGIGRFVNSLKEGFFKLTDAIGLTSFAFQDMQKKIADNFERNTQRQLDTYDRLIKLQQALGKETIDLEIAKQRAIIHTAELQLRPLIRAQTNIKRQGQETPADLQAKIDELTGIVDDANAEIDAINGQAAIKAKEKEKAALNERLRAMQEFLKNRAEAEDDFNQNRDKADAADADARQKRLEEEFDARAKAEQAEYDFEESSKSKRMKLATDEFNEKQALAEKEKEERKQRIKDEVAGINQVLSATLSANQTLLNNELRKIDKLSQIQSKRVEDAKNIADQGNAELLELEQKRLNDLTQKREIYVKRQQELAAIELVANSAIAVSKAAAQGGVAAAFTIAATLIALVAGLAEARSIASQAAFYEGGYTGDGDPKQASNQLGQKPYTYHKGEFVFDHNKTGKYRDIFEDIHSGNIDLNQWRDKVQAFETMKMMPQGGRDIDITTLEKQITLLRMAVEGQSTSLVFDEHGLNARFKNIKSREDFIKNNIARA